MNRDWFWVLLAGIVGGFAFAAGSSIEGRVEKRLSSTYVYPPSTVGAGTVGSRTGGVY
ncbi:MAG TPA: hypothetical protein VFB79_07660 [Candidatus Angelobacter sp.]|nr:hypothetical protein [Candidatus Angelobacter sp.]